MNSSVGRIGRILGLVLGLVGFVALLAWIGNAQDRANDPQQLAVEVSDQDWSKGGANAPVTIVEYSDFQCPGCAAYYPILKSLEQTYGDQVKIVYRHFPLTQIHANAQLAAQATEAAGMQGKFFEMHDKLFEEQTAWENVSNPTSMFVEYATAIGLNVEQFQSDLTSTTVKRAIADDVAGGNRSRVGATPTFFLNGVQLTKNPQGVEPFKQLIDAALAETSSASAPETDTVTP